MNSIYKCGNEALLERRKTAFLCSRRTPEGVEKVVDKWLNSLQPETDCVMCGDQSSMERRVFTGLLQRGIPTILMLAEALPDTWNTETQAAMKAGKLLAITHCDASVHWASARSAHDRNLLMVAWADEVVVGFCTDGGNLSRELANAKKTIMLFKAAEPYSVPQTTQSGVAKEPAKTEAKQVDAQWRQRMWSVNGAITIEQDTAGAEPCFRIWQIRDFDVEGSTNSKIVLNARELQDFYEALGEVIIQVGDKELANVKAMTVRTRSGDVTFEFKMLTSDGVLVITQSTETKFMGLHKRSVLINALEIRGFFEKVSEAAIRAAKLR